ncbi:MAG: hypothetical protein GWN01_16135 [Nitrosopumilaceae archaeon]|nr:hypothetical protein [Nitrosopumilaceae archaeon]NIU02367.1 hypothetical protein [Nitrosopumilaceae archaeon]NIU88824.1 hypothetical protein [Nitrosopumilaceae archaeon]NIV66949.1 hypothetical protein [Nitrosopumilaceae archaeon]NIX62968.1 hypothetical protein [Nitrosopumilaceae archaeon]
MGIGIGGNCNIVLIALLLSVTALTLPSLVFAQESNSQFGEFTKIEGEQIKNNPTAQQILERIEESKRILAEMQSQQPIVTEHQKFIQEQRRIAQKNLQRELDSMSKQYEEYSPRSAFSKFVSKLNSTHHGIYWDQFNYMEEKIILAREAKQLVLDAGGSFQDAQREYIKFASMPRSEMIQTIIDLNIKHGFAEAVLQENFDQDGKLPRYENDSMAKCYGCQEYLQVRDRYYSSEDTNPYLKISEKTSQNESNIQFVTIDDHGPSKEKEVNVDETISKLENKMDELAQEMIEEDDPQRQDEILDLLRDLGQTIEELNDVNDV